MKLKFVLSVVWLVMMLPNCSRQYTFQLFTFPPGTKPDSQDWEYTMSIFVYSNENSNTISKKEVRIFVYNLDETYFLKDKYKLRVGNIRAKVHWDNFHFIELDLLEDNPSDPCDKPKILLHLEYTFNENAKRFERTN
jgi:hypothetical protein